jgi:hypothetical protein
LDLDLDLVFVGVGVGVFERVAVLVLVRLLERVIVGDRVFDAVFDLLDVTEGDRDSDARDGELESDTEPDRLARGVRDVLLDADADSDTLRDTDAVTLRDRDAVALRVDDADAVVDVDALLVRDAVVDAVGLREREGVKETLRDAERLRDGLADCEGVGEGVTDGAPAGRMLQLSWLFSSTYDTVDMSDDGRMSASPSPLTSAATATATLGVTPARDGDTAKTSKLLLPLLRSISTVSTNDAAARTSTRPSPFKSATPREVKSKLLVVYSVTGVATPAGLAPEMSSSTSTPWSSSLIHSSKSLRPLPSKSVPHCTCFTVSVGVYLIGCSVKRGEPSVAGPAMNTDSAAAPVSTSVSATTMSASGTPPKSHAHMPVSSATVAMGSGGDWNGSEPAVATCSCSEPLPGHHSATSDTANPGAPRL